MAYEAKPGSFSLFKNDRKEKDTHPDYRGDGKDLEGNDVWVSAWLKEGSKGKFLSCSFQLKNGQQSGVSQPVDREAARDRQYAAARGQAPNFADLDDDIPF